MQKEKKKEVKRGKNVCFLTRKQVIEWYEKHRKGFLDHVKMISPEGYENIGHNIPTLKSLERLIDEGYQFFCYLNFSQERSEHGYYYREPTSHIITDIEKRFFENILKKFSEEENPTFWTIQWKKKSPVVDLPYGYFSGEEVIAHDFFEEAQFLDSIVDNLTTDFVELSDFNLALPKEKMSFDRWYSRYISRKDQSRVLYGADKDCLVMWCDKTRDNPYIFSTEEEIVEFLHVLESLFSISLTTTSENYNDLKDTLKFSTLRYTIYDSAFMFESGGVIHSLFLNKEDALSFLFDKTDGDVISFTSPVSSKDVINLFTEETYSKSIKTLKEICG